MKRILSFPRPARVLSAAAVGGREERRGTHGDEFDFCSRDDLFGMKTWETAEGEMGRAALSFALKKAGLRTEDLSLLFAGDLQNQCVATSEGLCSVGAPFVGIFGACSTMAEGLALASLAVSSSPDIPIAAVLTSSHNCAAERQFRTPLEYGAQRTPTAQWTATAAGSVLLSGEEHPQKTGWKAGEKCPKISDVLFGRMVNTGVTDAANMGAAMAPAAADTLLAYFRESGLSPADFDLILTGDLGKEGSALLTLLLAKEGISLQEKHADCGMLLYDFEKQDVHCGGSGCGCIASLLSCHFLPRMARAEICNMLAVGTGALMSPSLLQQGGSITGVAHLIHLEAE